MSIRGWHFAGDVVGVVIICPDIIADQGRCLETSRVEEAGSGAPASVWMDRAQERRLVDSKVFWVRRGRKWPVNGSRWDRGPGQESSLQSFVSLTTYNWMLIWIDWPRQNADLDLGQWQWAGSRAGCPKRYKLCPVMWLPKSSRCLCPLHPYIAIWSSVAKSKFGQSLKFVGKIEKLLLN